jgi:hypothetical protein
MSQDLRNQEDGERGFIRASSSDHFQNDNIGFEGMNYEQVRQPYNQRNKDRNSTIGERKDSTRPDES